MTKKEVVSVAKELNKVLGLDPQIDTKQDLETLKNLVLQAADLIEPEDKISKKTTTIIDELRKEVAMSEREEDEEEEVADIKDDSDEAEEDEEEGAEEEEEEEIKTEPQKKSGVIASIAEMIEKAGKKGITKEEILTNLVKRFPERQEKSMKNTINVQVPNRIDREKFKVEKVGDRYRKKA